MTQLLSLLDWGILVAYFAIILLVGWWVTRNRKESSDEYFLAGRNLGWFVVGASIFASNIGSEHIVGLAGSGATDGVAMAHYELHAWCLLVLGWVLAPFFLRSRVFTMPEFLERRYAPGARYVLSVISLVAYVLTKVAVGIFAGGVVFGVLLPEVNILGLDSFWIGSIAVIVLTGAYTISGGLAAVAYTEALQTVLLVLGSLLVTVYGLEALGGWDVLRDTLGPAMFNLWKPMVPEGMTGTWAPVRTETHIAWYFNGDYPWAGMLFCAPIIGLWYWCTDQYIVQRLLGAANLQEARRGTLAASFLKLLPVFIFIIPGMICYALALSGKIPALGNALLDSQGNLVRAEAQQAFPLLVAHVLPSGIRGLVVAGLLAALMSSLAGVFNAASTLFTMDLYARFRSGSSDKRLVMVGKIATAAMVIIGLLWIPVIQGSRGLYDYLQRVQGYLAPPIFVVFFFGIANRRMNSHGAMATLVVGFLLGLFRLAVDTPVLLHTGFSYTPGSILWIVNQSNFQYYSLGILLVSGLVMVGVSCATPAPQIGNFQGLTLDTESEDQRREVRAGIGWLDVAGTIGVLLAILACYLYFVG